MTETTQSRPAIAILGGDIRQLAAAEVLRAHGYPVAVSGFDTYGEEESQSPNEALAAAEVLLLPIPTVRNDLVNLPFSASRMTVTALLSLVDAVGGSLTSVFGGLLPPSLTEPLIARGLRVTDLCEDERFNLMNAVPTAEGALAVAMEHLSVTLHGTTAAVLGFGRIGKALCHRLQALGATVVAVARRESDLACAESYGYRAVGYGELAAMAPSLPVLFNTVPATVITEEVLARLPSDGVIIDLASRPYGVDAGAALRHGIPVIHALSLPGKVAPKTAGAIVARCLMCRLEGVPL